MMLAKKIARKLVFPSLTSIGAERLWLNFSKNNHLNITYHGVVKNPMLNFSPRHIELNQFEKQLQYFKTYFEVIPQSEAFLLNYNYSGKPKISISFDDGYLNNIEFVLPLIEKYEIPVSFFITGIGVESDGTEILWPDLLAGYQFFFQNERLVLGGEEFLNMISKTSGIHLFDFIKGSSYEARKSHLDIIEQKFNLRKRLLEVPHLQWKLMNREELKKLASSPFVEIGSHSHAHYNLGEIELHNAIIELEKSKATLERFFEREIDMLAYPDGSYSEVVKDAAEKIGYKYQLAVHYNADKDIFDSRILNRHSVASTTSFDANVFHINRAFYKGVF